MLQVGDFDKEIAVMQRVAGASPFFGFYGSGEIGCKAADGEVVWAMRHR